MTIRLDDRYERESGSVYLTGIQALVRLPIDQMRRDRRAGLNTGAYITGYEGSPLGGYDLALARAGRLLDQHGIVFRPGVNEELAATAIFGSQIAHVTGKATRAGVVGIWYGKGPGVDRSGDILRHGNLAGTGPNGAVLVLGGDDHVSKSSTVPHQSDFSFFNYNLPVLHPGNTQEVLDYGLLGIALSRYSGAWVGMKLVTAVCDGGGTVEVDPSRPAIALPEGYEKRHDHRLVIPYTNAMEPETNVRRLDAAREFASLNGLNRWFGAREGARLGIASAGKPYYDLMQALRDLGIARDDLDGLGVRIAKFGMTYPLEARFVRDFARGLSRILVIEEKRSFLELHLRDALYDSGDRPAIIGKQDSAGAPLLPPWGELDPETIARILEPMFGRGADRIRRLDEIAARERSSIARRLPNFCSGCPHNRSLLLLPGQVAGGGIGCHGMAGLLDHLSSDYIFFTQMGGEGAPWIGMSPFVDHAHIFQNVGDGTYFHSGQLSIQAAIAAGVNITYRILYNGVVAMTGGQVAAGTIPVPELTRKLEAEGVRRTVVVTDDLAKYEGVTLAANAALRYRDDLPAVMRELERTPGVTVIVYDQPCAAETRRLRARGRQPQPLERLVIHEAVCEGCGDCARQSNCISLHTVETPDGQKTRIHQSSCNVDESCLLGDCPSFLTVRIREGTGLKRHPAAARRSEPVPEPAARVRAGDGYSILAPGIGGTGVVTVNALLATAAWIDGLSVITLDQTGLAQKGGAVVSSIILSDRPMEGAARIGWGNADLILGFDLLGAATSDTLERAHPSRTIAVLNAGPAAAIDAIAASTDASRNVVIDAGRLAEVLFGSHLPANILLLGAAWQAGLVPLTLSAIEESVRLNGVEQVRNLEAFHWGRRAVHDPASVAPLLGPERIVSPTTETYAARLAAYQNRAWADTYARFVADVEARQPALVPAVARYLYKLMAYKDEYEVARLLTGPEPAGIWEAPESVSYNLHPPLLRALGLNKKLRLGPWFRTPLRLLAAMKWIRGTPFDLFGYAGMRRQERALIVWYREIVGKALDIAPADPSLAATLVALPDRIRGYEDVKQESIRQAMARADELLGEAGRPARAS